jgi:hypothetical protein
VPLFSARDGFGSFATEMGIRAMSGLRPLATDHRPAALFDYLAE